MNTVAATPMTKERASEILYLLALNMLKEERITQKGKAEFVQEIMKDYPLIGTTNEEMGDFVNFISDDIVWNRA